MTISLCVPSRGRPGRFATMLRSARATAAQSFEVCAWLDEDDPSRYPQDPMVRYGSGPRPYVDGSLCTSGLWSKAWELASGDIACLAADDILFHSVGWDAAVEEAFVRVPDQILMVYADDGTRRKAPVNPFVSRRWIELAGFTPEGWQGWFADEHIWQMAAELGRVTFLRQVRIAHVQRRSADATYRDGEAARAAVGDWPKMRERFYSPQVTAERDALTAKLRAAMDPDLVTYPTPHPDWLVESLAAR